MATETTEFILFAEAESDAACGQWHFSLESTAGEPIFVATDAESSEPLGRLELLAVVRGLEALDQPSQVTLVTRSAYVRRGIRFGLDEWRNTEWRWERFGHMVPVTNADLWQRLDQAMQIHTVTVRTLRLDLHHAPVLRGPHFAKRRNKQALLARKSQKQASSSAGPHRCSALATQILQPCQRSVAAANPDYSGLLNHVVAFTVFPC